MPAAGPPALVAFQLVLFSPSGSGAALPLPRALADTLAALRCDCAAFAGVELAAVRVARGAAINTGANATAELVAGAVAAANDASACAPTGGSRRRRHRGRELRLRALQVAALPWADFNLTIGVSAASAAGAAAATAALANAASSFPRSTAAWAPVWAYTPAAWAAAIGTAFALVPSSLAVVYSSATATPAAAAPAAASGALFDEQRLGLGLGVSLGLGLALALAALACQCAARRSRAASQVSVIPLKRRE